MGNNCVDRYQSNYQTITATTAPTVKSNDFIKMKCVNKNLAKTLKNHVKLKVLTTNLTIDIFSPEKYLLYASVLTKSNVDELVEESTKYYDKYNNRVIHNNVSLYHLKL
jgi:hypothetical protein